MLAHSRAACVRPCDDAAAFVVVVLLLFPSLLFRLVLRTAQLTLLLLLLLRCLSSPRCSSLPTLRDRASHRSSLWSSPASSPSSLLHEGRGDSRFTPAIFLLRRYPILSPYWFLPFLSFSPLTICFFCIFFPVSFFCFLLSLPCLFSVVFIVIFPFFPSFFRSLPWPLSSHAIAPVPEAPFLPGRPSPVMYSSTAVEDFLRRGKGKRLRAGAGNCKAGAAIFLHSLIFGSWICVRGYVCMFFYVCLGIYAPVCVRDFQKVSVVMFILFVYISNKYKIATICRFFYTGTQSLGYQKTPQSLFWLRLAILYLDYYWRFFIATPFFFFFFLTCTSLKRLHT